MRKIVTGALVAFAAGAIALGTLAACSLPTGVESGNILTDELPDNVSAEGVLLAAVILSSGDIQAAVEKSIVSSAEVNAARDAILANTLNLWRQRAETDVAVASK
jgi:hypothetical protein